MDHTIKVKLSFSTPRAEIQRTKTADYDKIQLKIYVVICYFCGSPTHFINNEKNEKKIYEDKLV
jgi:hypothetical protein